MPLTQKKIMVTVLAKLDDIEDLYVVEDSDTEECYIVKASNLFPYDKYWFDDTFNDADPTGTHGVRESIIIMELMYHGS